MPDAFERNLTRYRNEISQGRAEEIRRKLASGAIATLAKVRAANYALEEAERTEHEVQAKPTSLPKSSGWGRFRTFLHDTWHDPVWSKVIAGGIISAIAAVWAYWNTISTVAYTFYGTLAGQ